MKNMVYVIVIAVCLVLAVVIFVISRSGGSGGLADMERGELIWIKCNNPNCGAASQIDKVDYYAQIEDRMRENPMSLQVPALVCQECKENSVYRAVKCPKCGEMSSYGRPGDFDDRCPKCGFSEMEDKRKRAREARQAG